MNEWGVFCPLLKPLFLTPPSTCLGISAYLTQGHLPGYIPFATTPLSPPPPPTFPPHPYHTFPILPSVPSLPLFSMWEWVLNFRKDDVSFFHPTQHMSMNMCIFSHFRTFLIHIFLSICSVGYVTCYQKVAVFHEVKKEKWLVMMYLQYIGVMMYLQYILLCSHLTSVMMYLQNMLLCFHLT